MGADERRLRTYLLRTPPLHGFDAEGKAIRHVRTPEGAAHYGQPIGSVIVPDAPLLHEPRAVRKRVSAPTADGSRVKKRAQAVSSRKPARTAAEEPPRRRTKPRLAQNIALQDNVSPTTGFERAYGPENADQHVRARNLRESHDVEYGSRAELTRARVRAIKKGKEAPKPADWDIADNKRLLATSKDQNISDALRGDKYQRQANAWQVYIDFGGIDSKGNDKGYVLCVGCGVKMTWHSNPDFSKYPKFELDKIIVGADGGQYIPQNLVPLCSACNKQRGNKRMWESKAFANSKPRWYTKAYEARVKTIRPRPRDLKNGEGRPPKPVPKYPMPIPPGQVRVRTA